MALTGRFAGARTAAQAAALAGILAGLAGGCQKGTVQLAFYTDSYNHFPSRECEDEIFFLFRGDEYLYLDWQDVRILRLSVTDATDKASPLLDPTDTLYQALFDMRVESLVEPKGSWEFQAPEHQWARVEMPGIGVLQVRMDDTQYGLARLDKLRIDFEPDFLAKVRAMVAAPPQRLDHPKLGPTWRFRRRRVISSKTVTTPTGAKTEYRYTATKHFSPDCSSHPTVEVTAYMKKTHLQQLEATYQDTWEYWPVDPRGAGAAGMRLKPLKVERLAPRTERRKQAEYPGPEQPAANETILFAFEYPDAPAGWTKPAFLRDRTAVTDADGRAVLDLWPIVPAANVCDKLMVRFKSQDDPARAGTAGGEVIILRDELRPCWPRWQREQRSNRPPPVRKGRQGPS